MIINEEGCNKVSLLLFICNLNLNCSFEGENVGEVNIGEGDKEEIGKGVTDESKISDGSKSDNSSVSEISKSLHVVEGVVGIEDGLEEGKEFIPDDS